MKNITDRLFSLMFIITIAFTSCDKGKVNNKEYSEQLKERKIKRITPGEISTRVMKVGNLMRDTLDILFNHGKCDIQNEGVVKSFIEDFSAKVNIYESSDTAMMDQITKEVFQSAEYGVNNHVKEALEPNIQYMKNESWLYSVPLKKGQCGKETFSLLCMVISQPEIIKKIN